MANSPSHKFGQKIGGQFESAVKPLLLDIAKEGSFYLDFQHPRKARQNRKKVGWQDLQGNTHFLDYVIEEGGSEESFGKPRAFIEIAYRRYTRHSKAKVQEIEAAVTPIAERFQHSHPFLGAILTGDFTRPSLEQLTTHSFNIVYCPYETLMTAFSSEGADIFYEETSDDKYVEDKIRRFDRIGKRRRERIAENIRAALSEQFAEFRQSLRTSLTRRVNSVSVLVLAGKQSLFNSVGDAVKYITEFDQRTSLSTFVRYELNVRYTNGDEIRGTFQEKDRTIDFLRSAEYA